MGRQIASWTAVFLVPTVFLRLVVSGTKGVLTLTGLSLVVIGLITSGLTVAFFCLCLDRGFLVSRHTTRPSRVAGIGRGYAAACYRVGIHFTAILALVAALGILVGSDLLWRVWIQH